MVIARLKIYIQGAALRPFARGGNGVAFRMGFSGLFVVSLPDYSIILDNNRSD
jgi:hypothetical protein